MVRVFLRTLKSITTRGNGEEPFRTQTYCGTEGMLRPQTAISEESCALRSGESHRLEQERNSGGCTDVFDGKAAGQCGAPAFVP